MNDDLRRNMALFSMSIVMQLTHLTARQIRYYEQHKLIAPARNTGNQRLFSFNDVERLLEIKSLIEKGVNMAGIKQLLQPEFGESNPEQNVLDEHAESARKEFDGIQLQNMLKSDLASGRRTGSKVAMIQGQVNNYFK
jgi:MerR family transcriptional regulator, glutamine synthetase repressor